MNLDFHMSEEELQDLVGLPVKDACQKVENKGGLFRIVGEDGVSYPGTADVRLDRVDVAVEKGLVTGAQISK